MRHLEDKDHLRFTRLALLLALWSSAVPAHADEAIPASRRALLLTRILAYDSALVGRAGPSFVVGVVFRPRHAGSEGQAKEMLGAFKGLERVMISGLPVRSASLPFTTSAALEAASGSDGVDALFICDGLEGDMGAIKAVSRKRKMLTVGTTNAQVDAGVSVGVLADGDKLQIVVNLPQSLAEGADFSWDLLRRARVLR